MIQEILKMDNLQVESLEGGHNSVIDSFYVSGHLYQFEQSLLWVNKVVNKVVNK